MTDGSLEAGRNNAGRTVVLAGIGLALIAVIGVFMVFRFVALERQRDLQAWQVRLGIVADSRAAAVDDWVESQFATMRELSDNASLQLYMTELDLAGGKASGVTDEPAQAGYLRNLLIVTAERAGFAAVRGPAVKANVAPVGTAGIALIDARGRLLVATPGMPPIDGKLAEFLARRQHGARALYDIHLGADGAPAIGFLLPVHAVQAESDNPPEIGAVIGIRQLGPDFYRRLEQPGETAKSARTLLVRATGAVVEYLSPLPDGTPPLKRSMALDTPNLAAAYAIRHPGGFAQAVDYAGKPVLVTGRALAAAPWVVTRQIDAAEALADSDYRGKVLLATFLGSILVVSIVIVAVWRHGTSVRAAEAAERFRQTAERLGNLSRFLRVVTDGQPTAIAAVDGDNRYTFANRQAALQAGIAAEDMLGKDLASVLGPAKARAFDELNRQALQDKKRVVETHAYDENGATKVIKSDHIPLLPDVEHPTGGVLMIMEDVTDLFSERARRERTQKQLVATLVAVIDRRDPFAAHHSARVAEVARAIASEMLMTPTEVETAEIAASLMNLGKMTVPSELLTRSGELKEEEIKLIRASILAAADLLEGVEFDGPVVRTLQQLLENWDGSGEPLGLREDEILPTAQVVAVANAFVGMVSARAYRPGLDFDAAARNLIDQAGRRFSRRPVAALVNILDNRNGRARWASFAAPPETPPA